MNRYVIGIDPDSKAHGVAIYYNGKLLTMDQWSLMDIQTNIMPFVEGRNSSKLLFSIEDVMNNKFVYARNRNENKTVQSNIAMKVGRCQQSFIEVTRMLDFYKIEYKTFPPQKDNWAKNKKQFEMATGWKKRSNEDTRSAAFFGFLGCK